MRLTEEMVDTIAFAAVVIVIASGLVTAFVTSSRLKADTDRIAIERSSKSERMFLCANYREWAKLADQKSPGMEEYCNADD